MDDAPRVIGRDARVRHDARRGGGATAQIETTGKPGRRLDQAMAQPRNHRGGSAGRSKISSSSCCRVPLVVRVGMVAVLRKRHPSSDRVFRQAATVSAERGVSVGASAGKLRTRYSRRAGVVLSGIGRDSSVAGDERRGSASSGSGTRICVAQSGQGTTKPTASASTIKGCEHSGQSKVMSGMRVSLGSMSSNHNHVLLLAGGCVPVE